MRKGDANPRLLRMNHPGLEEAKEVRKRRGDLLKECGPGTGDFDMLHRGGCWGGLGTCLADEMEEPFCP